MPTYQEASRIIEKHLVDNWAFTPIAMENVSAVDYTSPSRGDLAEGESPFIAATVMYNTSAAAEIGEWAIKRTWGNLAVDFYAKEDTGTNDIHTNIDNLTDIFEYTTIQGIVFRDLTILRPVTSKGWHLKPTLLRFYFNR